MHCEKSIVKICTYIRGTPIHGSKTSLDYHKAREIGNH